MNQLPPIIPKKKHLKNSVEEKDQQEKGILIHKSNGWGISDVTTNRNITLSSFYDLLYDSIFFMSLQMINYLKRNENMSDVCGSNWFKWNKYCKVLLI